MTHALGWMAAGGIVAVFAMWLIVVTTWKAP